MPFDIKLAREAIGDHQGFRCSCRECETLGDACDEIEKLRITVQANAHNES